MAKKFVRGVTGIEDIESYNKTLTNVNDILSDGLDTYVHTKKGKNEIYYKLTDSVKTINSTENTIIVSKDEKGTVNLNTNTHKVLEHNNLKTDSQYVTIEHEDNSNTSVIKTDTLNNKIDDLYSKIPSEIGCSNLWIQSTSEKGWLKPIEPYNSSGYQNSIEREWTSDYIEVTPNEDFILQGWVTVPANGESWRCWIFFNSDKTVIGNRVVPPTSSTVGAQYFKDELKAPENAKYVRFSANFYSDGKFKVERGKFSTDYSPAPEDTNNQINLINSALSQKQNTLTSNMSIGVLSNNQLRQLFSQKQTYTHPNGLLKTHVKSLSENTAINTAIEEFNFTVKINQNAENIVVTLNEHDTTSFNKIMTDYGSNNTVQILGCVLTLSGSRLTIETTNNTNQNYVITFSDILD